MRIIIYLSLILSLSLSAFAQMSEADVEAKAREVGKSLRCVVCQNQSIDESDAPLAADMRKLVRKQLREGKSETEVIAYMQQTYGDYVLLKPPVQGNTYILWFGPFLILGTALFWFIRRARRESGGA